MKRIFQSLIVITLALSSFSGCKEDITLGIKPYSGDNAELGNETNCRLRSLKRSDGVNIGFQYDGDLVTNISGFPGFDQLIYKGGKLIEAKNSLLPEWEIKFQNNSKNQITGFTIKGRDGSGKLTNNSVTLKYDSNDRITDMTMDFQIIKNAKIKLEYNNDGNLTTIKQQKGNKYETVLENTGFDDLKSPFTDSPLRQIMAHFAVYNVLVGDTNYTNILCTNNPTASTIYNDLGSVTLNVEYDEQGGYASKANISKTVNNRLKSATETYDLSCGI